MERTNRKRYYEFVTTEEYHGKPTSEITTKALWEGFEEHTTSHGIPHVKNARGVVKKSFWLICSIVSVAGLAYYGYLLFDKFFDYPNNVRVEVVHERKLTYPAVTLCNHNPIRMDAVRSSSDPELREIFGLGNSPFGRGRRQILPPRSSLSMPDIDITTTSDSNNNTTTAPSASNSTDTDTDTNTDTDTRGREFGSNGRPNRENFRSFLRLQEYLATLPVAERSLLSSQISSFILDCEYSGTYCYSTDFVLRYVNSAYGNCFTFNLEPGTNQSKLHISHRPGPRYGLSLIMNIDQDEYYGPLAEEAGVRITVHDQSRMPFPEDEGISIMPGRLTYVGIKRLTVKRLADPYSGCVKPHVSNKSRNVFEEAFGVEYSASACFKTCYQYYVIDKCGCADSAFPTSGEAFGGSHISHTPCDTTDDEISACMDDVLDDYQEDKLVCDCPTACNEILYTMTTSNTAWPSTRYRRALLRTLAAQDETVRDMLSNRENPDKYKENLLKATIYFEEFNYEDITELAAYESFNLVSDIGGILGLFIGFSVITIVEFIELGLDLAILTTCNYCCCCKRNLRKNAINVSTADMNEDNPRDTRRNMTRDTACDMKLEDAEYNKTSPPPPYYTAPTATPRHVFLAKK